MSIASLLAVAYSNPGFVGDFFKSKKQTISTECKTQSDETQILPPEYHDIYYKEDYQNLNYSDDESPILVKPLATAEIEIVIADKEKDEKTENKKKDYSVESFYRY
jgi:hypothetical protein